MILIDPIPISFIFVLFYDIYDLDQAKELILRPSPIKPLIIPLGINQNQNEDPCY